MTHHALLSFTALFVILPVLAASFGFSCQQLPSLQTAPTSPHSPSTTNFLICLSPSTLITQLLTSTYYCCFFLLLLIPCTSYLSSLTHSHEYCHTLPSLTHASNAHTYFLPASPDFLLSLLYLPKPLPFFTVLFTFCPPWLFSVLILPSQEWFAIATFPHTVQPLFSFAFAACFHHFP